MSAKNVDLINDILEGDSDLDQPQIQPGNTTYVESVSDGSFKAFIRGFPSEYKTEEGVVHVTEDTVYNFFLERGIRAIDEIIYMKGKEASRSASFLVKFSNPAGLSEAIKENGTEFQGYKIEIKIDKPRRTDGGFGYNKERRGGYGSDYAISKPLTGMYTRDVFGQSTKTSSRPRNTFSQGMYEGMGRNGPTLEYRQPYRDKLEPNDETSNPPAERKPLYVLGGGNNRNNDNDKNSFNRGYQGDFSSSANKTAANPPVDAVKKQKDDPFGGAKPSDTANIYTDHSRLPKNSFQERRQNPELLNFRKNSSGDHVEQNRPTVPYNSGIGDFRLKNSGSTQSSQPAKEEQPKKPKQENHGGKPSSQKTENEKPKRNVDDDGWKSGTYVSKTRMSGLSNQNSMSRNDSGTNNKGCFTFNPKK